jgi:Spy/CpxP family protein refolding chaperone
MKNQIAIKFISSCALLTLTSVVFSQNSPPAHGQHMPTAAHSPQASPYAGEQTREIKSLSSSEIRALQTGAGMGYAKAAELNGYPGPMHVMELARPLQLNSEQRTASEQLMASHKAKARALGEQLLSAERTLDAAFASQQIDDARITALTQQIGALQATLRAEHLHTHLQQTALLNPQQIAIYQNLRGYGNGTNQDYHAKH